MDLNTCIATTESYHTIAYYSHLIPVSISALLIFFTLIKSKYSLLSKVFSLFAGTYCLWLIGSVIDWTVSDYHLVTAVWAPLDYINVIFFLAGAYFFSVLLNDGKPISNWVKVAFLGLSVPAWLLTITGHSITGFNQPQCEAFNGELLTNYKLGIEWFVCVYVVIFGIRGIRKSDAKKKWQIAIVALALLLFFTVFPVTEYVASVTGVYEINLYSLFILPVFLGMIIYSITNLRIFKIRSFGTQLLAYTLLILVGSQFFFLENTTNQVLTGVTLVLAVGATFVLLKNINSEEKAREKIEKLAAELDTKNTRLLELDKQKTEFISFATHQLRSPLTAMKGNASLILEGDFGPVSDGVKGVVQTIYTSIRTMINIVEDYLNVSRIELGTMKYDLRDMDFRDLVKEVAREQQPNIEAKGLKWSVDVDESQPYKIKADPDKFKQVLMNTIDNSVKYTPEGSIAISLRRKDGKALFAVKDTGVGIRADVMPKLFQKFSRAPKASEANIHGTGLGLFIAREIVTAHGGRVWAESAGEGQGSQFYVEVPVV